MMKIKIDSVENIAAKFTLNLIQKYFNQYYGIYTEILQ